MPRQVTPLEVIIKKLEVAGQITSQPDAIRSDGTRTGEYFASVYEAISKAVQENDYAG